jgi:hypothetical protein
MIVDDRKAVKRSIATAEARGAILGLPVDCERTSDLMEDPAEFALPRFTRPRTSNYVPPMSREYPGAGPSSIPYKSGKPHPSSLHSSLAHAPASLDGVTPNKVPLRDGIPNEASMEGDTQVPVTGVQLAGDSTSSFGDIDPVSAAEPEAAAQELNAAKLALREATQESEAAYHPLLEHFQRELPATLNFQNGPDTETEAFSSSGKKKTRRSRNKHRSNLYMGYDPLNLYNLLTAGMGLWLNQAMLMMNHYLQFSRVIMYVSVISLWF